MLPALSEVTALAIAFLFVAIWCCWVLSEFVAWLSRACTARHLRRRDWAGVLASAVCFVIGFIVYQPARWWETFLASLLLLGMAWTPFLVARWVVRVWRQKHDKP